MTDLEMMRRCAEAMGYRVTHEYGGHLMLSHHFPDGSTAYNPITNDEQVMALVKKFHLFVTWHEGSGAWCVDIDAEYHRVYNADLNRTIIECVAKMQAAKEI